MKKKKILILEKIENSGIKILKKKFDIFLSLSDDKPFAVATIVISV